MPSGSSSLRASTRSGARPREPGVPRRPALSEPALPYVLGWAVLLVLLGLSVASAYLPIGVFHPIVNFGIALTQTAILFLLFMKLRGRPSLKWVFASAGFFWLTFLFGLAAVDYFTRTGLPPR
jgi:cytochrome c oxidase subunit IV